MHTSTGADAVDEYAETVVEKGGRLFYRYGTRAAAARARRDYRPLPDGERHGEQDVHRLPHPPRARSCARPDGKWIASG